MRVWEKNMAMQVLLILAALALLWAYPIYNATPMPQSTADGILYTIIYRWLGQSPHWAAAISMVLILGEGLCLNLMLAQSGLVPNTSLLPTMLYTIAASASGIPLTPILLTNALLIAFVWQLQLHGTLLTVSTNKICAATSLLGIASLIYTPALLYLIPYLLIVVSYRLYNWRDWAALLLGIMAPYTLLLIILGFVADIPDWWQAFVASFNTIGFNIGHTTPLQGIANAVATALMLYATVLQLTRLGEHPVVWQKNATTTILMVIGGIATLLFTQLFPLDTALLAIPFALCGTHLLLPDRNRPHRQKRQWIYTVTMLILLIAAALC